MSTENKRKRKVIYYFLKIFENLDLIFYPVPLFTLIKSVILLHGNFFYNKLRYNEWLFSVPVIRYKASALYYKETNCFSNQN